MSTRDDLKADILDELKQHEGLTRSQKSALAVDLSEALSGYGKIPTREQLEAVIDEYEDEAAEGHCDCGNYRIDPDELSARVWALLQGGTQ